MTRPLTAEQRQRLRTPANLWRALIPLLVIAGVLVVLNRPANQRSDGVHIIDTAQPIAAARSQLGFPLAAPSGLSNRWRPTSTHLQVAGPASGASFRIGFVTPAGQYAELIEGNDNPDAVVALYGPSSRNGSTAVGPVQWDRYRTDQGQQLLRHTNGKVTTVISGNAKLDELVTLAAAVS